MEKFFLCTFLSNDKLHVIDHQDIHGSVFFTQLCHGSRITASDGFNYLVGKFLTGNIKYLFIRVLLQNEMTDGMHQVGFAKSGTSI